MSGPQLRDSDDAQGVVTVKHNVTAVDKQIAQPSPRRSLHRAEVFWAYIFILPTLVGLGLFSIWPTFQTFYFSFTEWGAFGGNTWTGLSNYLNVFQDPHLWRAFLNTFIFTAITLLGLPVSILVAVLLNRPGMRGIGLYRTLYFLPVVTLPAAIALVWKLLYNGDYGIINWLLSLVGVKGPYWLSDPSTALIAVSIVSVWGSIGYNMVLFLAGLQSIRPELYEAAQLDGAGPVRQFRSITMPLLTPTTFFVLVITIINSLQAFDLIFLMIGRTNPALPASKSVVYLFYEAGFIQNNGGYAAAIAFVLLFVIMIATFFQFRIQRRWVQYD